MDFVCYSTRLSDLTEYSNEFLTKLNKVEQIEQKRFQVINESMHMKSVSKVQFGQLNDKRFCFSNGIISLPYVHPYLEKLRKEKHKVIQRKKDDFLKEESKVIIVLLLALSFLVQSFNPIKLERKLNIEKERDVVKYLWDECILHDFVHYMYKQNNYTEKS